MRFRGKVEEGGTGFLLLAVQKMDQEPKNGKGRGRGKKETILSFHSPPPPSPTPSFTRSIFRAVFLCSGITPKRLLRRLYQLLHRRFPNNSKLQNNYSFNYTATGYVEIIRQVYSITFYISFLFYAETFKNMRCFELLDFSLCAE